MVHGECYFVPRHAIHFIKANDFFFGRFDQSCHFDQVGHNSTVDWAFLCKGIVTQRQKKMRHKNLTKVQSKPQTKSSVSNNQPPATDLSGTTVKHIPVHLPNEVLEVIVAFVFINGQCDDVKNIVQVNRTFRNHTRLWRYRSLIITISLYDVNKDQMGVGSPSVFISRDSFEKAKGFMDWNKKTIWNTQSQGTSSFCTFVGGQRLRSSFLLLGCQRM